MDTGQVHTRDSQSMAYFLILMFLDTLWVFGGLSEQDKG